MIPALTLILYYKPGNIYGLNVVLGALEMATHLKDLKIVCAEGYPELLAAIAQARQQKAGSLLVAWSFHSIDFPNASKELARVKKHTKPGELMHVAGGAHATACPDETLKAGFDLVVLGEGERTMLRCLESMLEGKDPGRVSGTASLGAQGLKLTKPTPLIDLDEFPPFALKQKRFNPIEITRGCIHACKFCQTSFLFKAQYRHRSVENICHYVNFLKRLGLTDIRFITPSCLSYGAEDETVHLEKVEDLLSSIRAVLGNKGRIFFGTFPSELRPEQVTPESLKLLKKYAANSNLVIGAQSGSDEMLRITRRGHTVDAIRQAVRLSLEAGFLPNVDFIFGLPDETPADLDATLKLAEELSGRGARIHGHAFLPLPGTPYQDKTPSQIDATALRELGRFTAEGRLYGQWKQQLKISKELQKFSAA